MTKRSCLVIPNNHNRCVLHVVTSCSVGYNISTRCRKRKDLRKPFKNNFPTRDIGYLKFSDFKNNSEASNSTNNLLNNVWFQPDEVFPVKGEPEAREHAFWIPVNEYYYAIAEKLKVSNSAIIGS